MRKFLILLIGGLSILSLEAGGSVFQWHYIWHRDQMTDKVSCVAISPKVLFSLRATGDSRFLNSWVKLVVTDSGILQIESESPFDARRSAQIGVRINDDPPDLGVSLNQTATVALFSAERSAAIIQRMLKGGSMKVQAAFFPFAELAVKDFSLTDFGTVMIQRAGCLTLRDHQGWFGAYWQPVEVPGAVFPGGKKDDPAGIGLVVWTINPDKAAAAGGLKVFDALLLVNGNRVTMDSATRLLNEIPPGERGEIVVLRDGRTKKLKIQRPRP